MKITYKDGKPVVTITLKKKNNRNLPEEERKKLEQQLNEMLQEKLEELDGLDGKTSEGVRPTATEDGGDFYTRSMNGWGWLKTIGNLGASIWETSALPQDYWNKDKAYDKSPVHLPPTFSGVSDGVINEVTDLAQLAKLGYDVATKKEVREGVWNAVKNMSYGSVRSLVTQSIKDEIDGWNFSDKPWEGYHKLGQRGVQIATLAFGGFIQKGAKESLKNGVEESGKKFIKKIDPELDKIWQLSRQKLGRLHNSKVLGENLEAVGKVRPPNSAAHHIVAGGANNLDAKATRILLEDAGIDINEAANGVFLPKNSKYVIDEAVAHTKVHTDLYYKSVYDRLVKSPIEEIRDELNKISQELLSGAFPY